MGITSTQHKARLKNEYNELFKLPFTSIMKWKIAPGQSPPYVSSYLVTYTNPYLIMENGVRKICKDPITLQYDLDKDYPASAPKVRVVEGKLPYQPNFFLKGGMCTGTIHKPGMWLWDMFATVGSVLTGGKGTNPGSPANRDAADYYSKNPSKFPLGRTDFPRPKGLK